MFMELLVFVFHDGNRARFVQIGKGLLTLKALFRGGLVYFLES